MPSYQVIDLDSLYPLPIYGPECDTTCPCHTQPLSKSRINKAPSLAQRLNILDRYLTVWILLTMIAGLLVGYFAPYVGRRIQVSQVVNVPAPVAVGLIVMLLPVFCKVPYEKLRTHVGSMRTQIIFSLVINWILGPFLMTGLPFRGDLRWW